MWTDAGVSPEGGNTASKREEGRDGEGGCACACALGGGALILSLFLTEA